VAEMNTTVVQCRAT